LGLSYFNLFKKIIQERQIIKMKNYRYAKVFERDDYENCFSIAKFRVNPETKELELVAIWDSFDGEWDTPAEWEIKELSKIAFDETEPDFYHAFIGRCILK